MKAFAKEKDIFSSKPQAEGRLQKEMRCYELLEALGIEYFGANHEPAATIEDCLEVEQVLGAKICKNLFLCNSPKTSFYLLMMPGDKPFKTKDLSKQINSARLSFAGAEFMEEFLDITPGSVSVLGLMNDKGNKVKLLIDKDLLSEDFIGCHPCINTTTLKLRTEDLIEKLLPSLGHAPTIVEL